MTMVSAFCSVNACVCGSLAVLLCPRAHCVGGAVWRGMGGCVRGGATARRGGWVEITGQQVVGLLAVVFVFSSPAPTTLF